MDRRERQRRRQAFGRAVDAYDATRPDYPAAAVSWCVGEPASRLVVCDLGAGTGKLTAALLALGHEVVAVDPDAAMLARLDDNLAEHEGLETRQGSAEDVPIDDGAVDAVVAGQAWHWFDPAATASEVTRIVRPGGTCAALWNSRDEQVAWVARWSEIAEEQAHPTGRKALAASGGPDFGAGFGPMDTATFEHVQSLAPDDLVTLAASRSHTISLPAAERAALLDAVRQLVATHPDLAGRTSIDLPLRVECYRATRR